MLAFPLGRVAGAISIELGKPHGQQQFQIDLLAPHQDGTKQGRRCSYSPPRPWTTSGSLSREFSQQGLSHQSFVGRSGYMTQLTSVVFSQLGEVVRHSGSANFTAAHFVVKCHTRGVTRGAQCSGAKSLGGAEMSQQCRKFFLQCNTFTFEIP